MTDKMYRDLKEAMGLPMSDNRDLSVLSLTCGTCRWRHVRDDEPPSAKHARGAVVLESPPNGKQETQGFCTFNPPSATVCMMPVPGGMGMSVRADYPPVTEDCPACSHHQTVEAPVA